jgi:hypothetical protein
MVMRKSIFVAGVALVCLFAPLANAAVITRYLHVNATDFVDGDQRGNIPPFASITASITITYDDAARDVQPSAAGLAVTVFDFPFRNTIRYTIRDNLLSVGNNIFFGGYSLSSGGFDFGLGYDLFDGYANFAYATPDNNFFIAATTNVISSVASAPEPTTWALMISGVGMVGGAMRRRRTVSTKVSFA